MEILTISNILDISSVFLGQNIMNVTAGNTFVQIVKILYMF